MWRRDPVQCVKEIMRNPAFKEYMSYIAEHVYVDEEGKLQIYDEMWMGDWWWNMQVSLLNYIDHSVLKLCQFYKEKTSQWCNNCYSYPFFG